MKIHLSFLIVFCIACTLQSFSQQASLTIINKSNRQMTTKVIKGTDRKGTIHSTVNIPPNGKQIVYFSETGQFFTKTRAILVKPDQAFNDTLYSKSFMFQVIADKRGYSNITLKMKIKESKKPVLHGLIPISRHEYDNE